MCATTGNSLWTIASSTRYLIEFGRKTQWPGNISAGIIQEQGTLTVGGGTMSGGQISLSLSGGVVDFEPTTEFDLTGGIISGQGNTAPGTPKPRQGSNALGKVGRGRLVKVSGSPTIAANVQNNGTINFTSANPLFDQGAAITNSGTINISSSNIDVTLNNVSSSITNNANIFTSGGASTCSMPINNSGASALLSVDSDFSVVGNTGGPAITQSGASAATDIYAPYELTCTGGYSQSDGILETTNVGANQVAKLGGNVSITGGAVSPAASPANSYGELYITSDAGSGTFSMSSGTLKVAVNVPGPPPVQPQPTTNFSWIRCAGAATVRGITTTLSITTTGVGNIHKATTWYDIKSDTSFNGNFGGGVTGNYAWTESPGNTQDNLTAPNAPPIPSSLGPVATQLIVAAAVYSVSGGTLWPALEQASPGVTSKNIADTGASTFASGSVDVPNAARTADLLFSAAGKPQRLALPPTNGAVLPDSEGWDVAALTTFVGLAGTDLLDLVRMPHVDG